MAKHCWVPLRTPLNIFLPCVKGPECDLPLLKYECDYFKKVQKGHGRLGAREIWTSTQLSVFLEKEWTGVAQVFMIRKMVIEKGKKVITLQYGMTNVPRKKENTEKILQWR